MQSKPKNAQLKWGKTPKDRSKYTFDHDSENYEKLYTDFDDYKTKEFVSPERGTLWTNPPSVKAKLPPTSPNFIIPTKGTLAQTLNLASQAQNFKNRSSK